VNATILQNDFLYTLFPYYGFKPLSNLHPLVPISLITAITHAFAFQIVPPQPRTIASPLRYAPESRVPFLRRDDRADPNGSCRRRNNGYWWARHSRAVACSFVQYGGRNAVSFFTYCLAPNRCFRHGNTFAAMVAMAGMSSVNPTIVNTFFKLRAPALPNRVSRYPVVQIASCAFDTLTTAIDT
jgi:hypothetical protein